jgi:hypothetical protein
MIYKYAYESSFNSFFDGTDNNDPKSELFISAEMQLTFPTKCQGQIKLSSVRLKNQYGTFDTLNKETLAGENINKLSIG